MTSRPVTFCRRAGYSRSANRQRGASLIVSLLMLIAVAMLGLSAAQIALQEEKASRNENEHQIAMQAAEAALTDAESDIENSPRSYLFAQDRTEGFAPDCNNGQSDVYLGLCQQSENENLPVWQTVDFTGEKANQWSVPYGHFTGRILQTGTGPQPIHPPRYIIERLAYSGGTVANGVGPLYRITAIGFGMRDSTLVVLQTLYGKSGNGRNEMQMPAGRLSWREIPNWKELHDALAKN